MAEHFDALLESISGAPVLNRGDLALAFLDGQKSDRLAEVKDSLAVKPSPKIPPRYESEIRTWLARAAIEGLSPGGEKEEATQARIQAYSAVHLDPHNTDAIGALDAALLFLQGDVRMNTWRALSRSYPEVQSVRNAAEAAGVVPPDPAAVKAARRRAPRRKPTSSGGQDHKGDSSHGGGQGGQKRKRRPRASGLARILPLYEPDPVKADRLAVINLAMGVEWTPAASPLSELDPLSWATRRMAGEEVGDPPRQAVATADFVLLTMGMLSRGEEPGPRYGHIIKRLKGHPAVVLWATKRQLDAGDFSGARKAFGRVNLADYPVFADEVSALSETMAIVNGDADIGWRRWESGELPAALRAPLAEALIAAGRETQADEVMGLPEVLAASLDDRALLELRFDLMFVDGYSTRALEQAFRLVELGPFSRRAVGRLWLALAFSGRQDELLGRVDEDAERVGVPMEEIVDSVRSILSRRVARVTQKLTEKATETRASLQHLAKGKTIRNAELFTQAVATARSGLDELQPMTEVLGLKSSEYPQALEDLLTLLAVGTGRTVSVEGDKVLLFGESSTSDHPVLKSFTAPAQEICARSATINEMAKRALLSLDSAVEESGRVDLARRRLEERVSKQARQAADLLNAIVVSFDLSSSPPTLEEALESSETDAEVKDEDEDE